jgi:hypothetical protein
MKLEFTNEQTLHPMLSQEYALFTPPIANFFNVVCEWIENKVPGAYIYGVSRLGKSWAIRFWINKLIEEEFLGKIFFFYMIYKNHQRPQESNFYSELLSASGHLFNSTGTTSKKFERLVTHLCTRAHNIKSNHIVLMIDEAQFMHNQEYEWLCNIQNEIVDAGFRLTVISVGSHELTYQHEIFSMAESAYLLSRFMVRSQVFHGIRNIDELEYVLKGYDENSEWPENSGITYTQYFFPRAYKAGFRLADISSIMWEVLQELAPDVLKKKLEVPMEHIAKSVEYVFRQLSSDQTIHINIDKSLVTKAIKQTSYEQHMRAVSIIIGRKSRET